MIGIYKIQSKVKPERYYIGSSTNVHIRWKRHLSYLRSNSHHSSKLQRHYNKYGESDLLFSPLSKCKKTELVRSEQFYLDHKKPFFNECKFASSVLGIKRSKEFCENLRLRKLGNTNRLGQKHTEETKRRISMSEKGKIVRMKTRLKISESRKGIKLSTEHKAKISKSLIGNKNAQRIRL